MRVKVQVKFEVEVGVRVIDFIGLFTYFMVIPDSNALSKRNFVNFTLNEVINMIMYVSLINLFIFILNSILFLYFTLIYFILFDYWSIH